ncbi:hypothetical protein CQ12_40310 [Bradyrhizobium jicamae]|uniref:Uncharacterized protein n=1 Tax=Bradyrhizobium jicamae TaxID=280332 RepID=A0A0R3LL76_9BRAD|nr:hypothetical protein [Bradyrhizobium jicamae]KRR08473.1 hypothetical protein CQ12_40310 [Bradyrhizobium jicamae]
MTELYVNAAIAIIALAALGIAVWEGIENRRSNREQRLHDQMSVRPLLAIRQHLGGSQGYYGLDVTNEGLGPAAVKNCTIKVGGDELKDDEEGWKEALSKPGLAGLRLSHGTITNSAMRPGQSVRLLSAELDKTTQCRLADAFRKLDVIVSYESLYSESWVATFRG